MSSAVSNSSARRRRTAQPKVQERIPQQQQQQQENLRENDYEDESIPVLGVKESIMYLNSKINTIENYLQKTYSTNNNQLENTEIKTNVQDMKRTIDELSLKLDRVDLSIEKVNLVLKLHDTYINKIKTMVEFENVEQVTSVDVQPHLLEATTTS